ncbi:hypothetical protein Tco_1074691 [Tanacetum coccineum]
MTNTSTPLLQELARAADFDDIMDQLLLRKGVRMRDSYIRELWTSDMSNEVVYSIEILKRVQLDVMEKASRLLLMVREIQSKVF